MSNKPELDADAFYAQQEREHHQQLDNVEAEREEQAWFDENGEWHRDADTTCQACAGTGQDWDLTPCPECDGEGFYYWL